MNRIREIDINNGTHYFSDGIISIKNVDPNTLKTDEESYSNILIYYIFYVTTISTKPLHFIINNANGHIEENKGKKYLAPVPTNETKDKLKNYVKQQIITRMIMIKNI